MNDQSVRAFIAIELPVEIKQQLAGIQSRLRAKGQLPVRWVEPEAIHLTLKFLGNIATGALEDILGVMREVSGHAGPFELGLEGLGTFPGGGRVRVIWVGVGGEIEKLSRLQQYLEEGLAALGFAREARPFSPHLTLGRVRDNATPAQRQEIGQVIAKSVFSSGERFRVDSFHLFKSQLTPGGPVYSRLGTVVLG